MEFFLCRSLRPVNGYDNRFHIMLTLRDDGSPNLFAYRRVIVHGTAVADETPLPTTRRKSI